mmetsp:Transcript_157638/g.502229  ORF Transcript_157638/g.502229 Transcript_157638/m.502229 type:complete len:371 (+) Transcript_157638:270-1382(+)
MPARRLKGVVVVVPALSVGEDADDPIVHRVVVGVPILEAEDMADGVHGPSHVPHPDHSEEKAPHHKGQPSDRPEDGDRQHDAVQGIGRLQHAVKPLLRQVIRVGLIPAHPSALAVEEPAHVRPKEAIQRGVHIVLRLGAAVVVAVRGDPIDRVALEGQDTAIGEQILQELRGLEGPMGQLPVVGQGDAEHAGNDVHDQEAVECWPCEEEGGSEGAGVDDDEEDGIANVLGEPLPIKVSARVHDVIPELAIAGAEKPLPLGGPRQSLLALGPLAPRDRPLGGLHGRGPSRDGGGHHRHNDSKRRAGGGATGARRRAGRRHRDASRGQPAGRAACVRGRGRHGEEPIGAGAAEEAGNGGEHHAGCQRRAATR